MAMPARLGARLVARSRPLLLQPRVGAPGAVPMWRRFATESGADESKLEELREKIAETRAQVDELIEKRVSIKQDAQQAAKRHETDVLNESKYGITKFAKVFLQIPDNLERAVGCVKEEDLASDKELIKMKATVKQMQKIVNKALRKFGVEEMKVEGEVFDPQKHEAMFMMEMPGKDPNTIFHVMEPGYQIHDRTLRAARVGVVRG